MTAVDESTVVEPGAASARRQQWVVLGLGLLVLGTICVLFALGVGDASAAGGCGGG